MRGVDAVRGAGYIAVPGPVALDAAADTGTKSEDNFFTFCLLFMLSLFGGVACCNVIVGTSLKYRIRPGTYVLILV